MVIYWYPYQDRTCITNNFWTYKFRLLLTIFINKLYIVSVEKFKVWEFKLSFFLMVLSYLMGKQMGKPGDDFILFYFLVSSWKACWRTPDVCVDDLRCWIMLNTVGKVRVKLKMSLFFSLTCMYVFFRIFLHPKHVKIKFQFNLAC
jgi:hypothetical protein